MVVRVKCAREIVLPCNFLVSPFCLMGVGTYRGRIRRIDQVAAGVEVSVRVRGVLIPLCFRVEQGYRCDLHLLKGCAIRLTVDHMSDENGNTLYYVKSIKIIGGKHYGRF